MMFANEVRHRPPNEVTAGIDAIAEAMDASIDAGCSSTGVLARRLKVKRRAPQIADDIRNRHETNLIDPLAMMDWINLWAMAVNEENAAGGKVVTAPTNGAARIIPAVIRFYRRGYRGDAAGVRTFLLAAGAGRRIVQAQRQHLGRRGRLSGRGRRCLFDGGGGADRGARRHQRAGRECRRDRHGA